MELLAKTIGENVDRFNRGMMSQMQENPDSTDNDCYRNTVLVSAEISALADFSQYVVGGYDSALFLELFQIMLIKLTQELDSCNYNEFLIALDGMLSNIPQAAAAGVNMFTQITTGFTNKDTSIYIAVNRIEAGMADDNNWYDFGAGFQLALAQLLKVSAGESDIDVTPTGF